MRAACLLAAALCLPASAAEVLVVFSSPECGYCTKFKRDYEADPSIAGGRGVVPVNVNVDRRMAKQHRVRVLPTFIVMDGEREVRRQAGYHGAAALKGWLDAAAD